VLQRKKPLRRRSALKSGKPLQPSHTTERNALGRLWTVLRDRDVAGLRFRQRQVVGPYVVDFICPAARLVLLLDGAEPRDPAQVSWLTGHGYRVLRIAQAEALANPDMVLNEVAQALQLRVVSREN
jgi:very-short-patch-repair endonuclease